MRTRLLFAFASALIIVIATALIAIALDDKGDADGALTVNDAWVRETIPVDDDAGVVTGAFMQIKNTTGATDTLVSTAVDPAIATVVELHETVVDVNDRMQMRPVEGGIPIPANTTVDLKPGGYHVMLIDVQRTLTPGETVILTLTFESGTVITVEAEVRELGAMGNMNGMGGE